MTPESRQLFEGSHPKGGGREWQPEEEAGQRSLLGSATGLIRQSPSTGAHLVRRNEPRAYVERQAPSGGSCQREGRNTPWWEDETVLSLPAA